MGGQFEANIWPIPSIYGGFYVELLTNTTEATIWLVKTNHANICARWSTMCLLSGLMEQAAVYPTSQLPREL